MTQARSKQVSLRNIGTPINCSGRLAKVVGPNQLQGVGAGNDLASFAMNRTLGK